MADYNVAVYNMICVRVELRPFKASAMTSPPSLVFCRYFIPVYRRFFIYFLFFQTFYPSSFSVYFGDDKSDNLDRPKVFRDARSLRSRVRVICKSEHLFLCIYVYIDFSGVHIDPRIDVQTVYFFGKTHIKRIVDRVLFDVIVQNNIIEYTYLNSIFLGFINFNF